MHAVVAGDERAQGRVARAAHEQGLRPHLLREHHLRRYGSFGRVRRGQVFRSQPQHYPAAFRVLEGPGLGQSEREAVTGKGRPPRLGAELALDEIHFRRADEVRDEHVRWVVVDVERPSDLLNPAVLHHRDAIAERHGLDLVVGDVDRAGAGGGVQLGDLLAHVHAHLGVQIAERFVEQEGVGVAHQRAAERHPLHLTTGQLLGLAFQQLLDAENGRGVTDPLLDVGLRCPAHSQSEAEVVEDVLVGVQRVVLEHHRHVAVLGLESRHVAFTDMDDPFGNRLQSRHHAQRGRLSAARWPHEDHELTVGDGEAYGIDREGAAEPLGNAIETDFGHRSHLDRACRRIRNGWSKQTGLVVKRRLASHAGTSLIWYSAFSSQPRSISTPQPGPSGICTLPSRAVRAGWKSPSCHG